MKLVQSGKKYIFMALDDVERKTELSDTFREIAKNHGHHILPDAHLARLQAFTFSVENTMSYGDMLSVVRDTSQALEGSSILISDSQTDCNVDILPHKATEADRPEVSITMRSNMVLQYVG